MGNTHKKTEVKQRVSRKASALFFVVSLFASLISISIVSAQFIGPSGSPPNGGSAVLSSTSSRAFVINTSTVYSSLPVTFNIPTSTFSGNLFANSFVGGLSGTLNAINLQSGVFASSTGGGAFAFPASLGIGTSTTTGFPTNGLFVTGNIGIGASSVFGSGATFGCASCAASTTLELYNSSTGDTTLRNNYSNGDIILLPGSSGNVGIGTSTPTSLLTVGNNNQFTVSSGGGVQANSFQCNGSSCQYSFGGDTFFLRDAAGSTIAQRTGTTSQTFRLYNTYTDASNYERLAFAGTAGGAFTITSQAAGTGSVRNIALMGGSVGIGTVAPSSTLHVVGTSSFTGGNVGIGTTVPTSTLTVAGEVKSTTGGFRFPDGTVQMSSAAAVITSQWTSTSTGIFYNSGSVGIGTVSPSTPLEVQGVVTSIGQITLGKAGAQNAVVETPESLIFNIDSNNDQTDRTFSVRHDGTGQGGGTELFRIQENGNVGIGTVAPSSTLHVVGTSTLNGNIGVGTAPAADRVSVSGNVYATGLLESDSVGANYMLGKLAIGAASPGTAQLYVATGSVGIGTNNPTRPLQVSANTTSPVIEALGSLGSTSGIGFGVDGSGGYVQQSGATTSFRFYVNGASRFGIHYNGGVAFGSSYVGTDLSDGSAVFSGSVGVGASSTGQKFEVVGANSVATTTGSSADAIARFHPTGSNAVLDVGYLSSPAYAWLQSRDRTNYATNFNLTLNPNGGAVSVSTTSFVYGFTVATTTRISGGAGTPGLIVNSSGYVAVGTTTPYGPLHIANIGYSDQTSTPDNATMVPSTTTAGGLVLDGSYSDGKYRTRLVKIDRGGNLPLYIQDSRGTSNAFTNIARFGSHSYSTNQFEVFGNTAIQGNLGVGTTTPAFALDVNGDVNVPAGNFLRVGGIPSISNQGGVVRFGSTNAVNVSFVSGSTTPTMYVSSTNIGIGTTVPTSTLTVVGEVKSTTGGFRFPDGTVQTSSAGAVVTSQWTSTSTGIFYNSGKVGIGTTAPGEKLDINGNLTFEGWRATPAYIYANGGADDSALFLKAGSTAGYFSQIEVAGWNGSGIQAHIGLNAGTGTGIYIANGNNVGIGTVAPSSTLHVVGTSTLNGNIGVGTAPAADRVSVSGNVYATGLLESDSVGANYMLGKLALGAASPGNAQLYVATGSVGIGSTSPLGKLHVEGSIFSRGGLTSNLVSDPQFSQSTTYWTSGCTQATTTMENGTIVNSCNINTTGNVQIIGDYIPVDPYKTYRFSIWAKENNNDSSLYFGMHSYNSALTQVNTYDSAGTGSVNSYFWTGDLTTLNQYRRLVGYLLPCNIGTGWTNPPDTMSSNFRMDCTASYVKIRFLNYDGVGYGSSAGTNAYFAIPSVEEVEYSSPTFEAGFSDYIIRPNGSVGIGTSSPAYKLDVAGTFRATGNWSLGGGAQTALNMNSQNITAVNKLSVTTIDPLYDIGGVKYSTYASAISGGVKEEYVGSGKMVGKKFTLNFDEVKQGSDLWVWRKVVDFSKDTVQVFVTPYGSPVPVSYEIDGNRIVFRSTAPVGFSYRLVGNRVDWREWPTYAKDQKEKANITIKK